MDKVKGMFGRLAAAVRRVWEWSSGDDLHEAQMQRGDYHEFKASSGGPGM